MRPLFSVCLDHVDYVNQFCERILHKSKLCEVPNPPPPPPLNLAMSTDNFQGILFIKIIAFKTVNNNFQDLYIMT